MKYAVYDVCLLPCEDTSVHKCVYHAAECGTQLVQAAPRREQQHFVLQRPRQFVENQLQHLPIRFLYERDKNMLSSYLFFFFLNIR